MRCPTIAALMPKEQLTDATDSRHTRVILIVSNGPLLNTEEPSLSGRQAISVPVQVPPMQLPAIATTMATGVEPHVHGIVTWATVSAKNPEHLQLVPIDAAQRRYPAFWTEAAGQGLRTMAINWPATKGDPDLNDAILPTAISKVVRNELSTNPDLIDTLPPPEIGQHRRPQVATLLLRLDHVLAEAHSAVNAPNPHDALCIALQTSSHPEVRDPIAAAVHERLMAFLQTIRDDAVVVIVNPAFPDVSKFEKPTLCRMTIICGGQVTPDKRRLIQLHSVGGAVRLLLGLPCPTGTGFPNWPFLTLPPANASDRPFPVGARSDDVDWDAIIERAIIAARESSDEAPMAIVQNLIRRFGTLARIALRWARWDQLADNAQRMVMLRGKALDHWMYVLSLDRGGNEPSRSLAIEAMVEKFPDLDITKVAQALGLIATAPDQVRALLQDINVQTLGFDSALGPIGRLCLQVKLQDMGEAMLSHSIVRNSATAADRVILANHLLKSGNAEAAFAAIGAAVSPKGSVQWSLLLLRILLATDRLDVAEQFADAVLGFHPMDPEVMHLMKR